MAITAAELKNVILGDDTSWQATVRRTQESLVALQAQSERTLAGLTANLTGLGRSFSGVTPAASQMASVTSGALTQLSAKITENKAGMALYGAAIVDNRGKMLDLSRSIDSAKQSFGGQSDVVKRLQAEYKTLSFDTRTLGVDKARLSTETAGLRVALGAEQAVMKEGEAAERAAQQAAKATSQALAEKQQKLESVKQSIASMGQELMIGGAIMTGVFGGAIAYSIKAQSDLSEAVNKVKVVFGESSKSIEDFAKSASTNLGLSQRAALDTAGSLGNMFVSMKLTTGGAAELSKGVLSLAADIASFNNIGVDDALKKLQSGLQGEIEPLRAVGVLLSDNAVKAKAAELGIKAHGNSLSEQQKVLLRYLVILDQTSVQQGDFARTATGMANSSRILAAQFEDLAAKIGDKFSTQTNTAIGVAVQLMSVFNNMPPGILATGAAVLTVEAAVGAAALGIGTLVALMGGPFTLALVGIGVSAGLMTIALAQNWDAVVQVSKAMSISVGGSLRGIVVAAGYLVDAISAAGRQMIVVFDMIMTGARILGGAVTSTFKAIGVGVAEIVAAIVSGDIIGIGKAFGDAFKTGFSDFGQKASEEMKGLITRTTQGFADTAAFMGGKTAKAFGAAFDEGVKAAQSFDFAGLKKKILDELEKLKNGMAGKGKGAGHAVGKELSDGFKDGVVGFQDAFKVIGSADTSSISALFDPLKKKARESLKELSDAFKATTPAVNEFLQAHGVAVKVTTEQLEKLAAQGNTSLLGYTLDWLKARDAVNQAAIEMAERLPVSLKDINTFLKDQGYEIQVTAEAWATMTGAGKNATVALANIVRGQQDLKAETVSTGAAIENLTANILAHKAAVNEALLAYNQHKITFAQYLDALHGVTAGQKIVVDSTENLGSAVRTMGERFDQALLKTGIPAIKGFIEENQRIESTFSIYEQYGQILGKTGQDLESFVENNVRVELSKIPDITKEQLDRAIETHKRAANQLPGIWESVLHDLDSSSRKGLNDMFAVIDSMPGKWGDSLRKTRSEVEQWMTFIDSSMKLIQHIMGVAETGLGGLLKTVTGSFGGISSTVTTAAQSVGTGCFGMAAAAATAATSIQSSNQQIGTSAQQMASQVDQAANQAAAAYDRAKVAAANSSKSQLSSLQNLAGGVMGILGGISTFMGTRHQGLATGILGGAMGGAMTGASIGLMVGGPAGAAIGALIGAAGGAILGIFGSGKTDLQKAQDAAALQQAKDAIKLSQQQVMQALEASKQAIVSTASQVADLIEKIGNSTHVPKAVIKTFVKDMGILLSQLADGLSAVSSKATPELKAAAETFQAVVGLAVAAPDAINAIGRSIPVAQSSFDVFFSNTNKLWDGFAAAAEETTKHERKAANKFAESYGNVIGTVAPSIDAVAGFFKIRRINQGDIDTWVANIVLIETGMTKAADSLDFYGVKQAARLSDSAGSVLDFIQKYAATQKDIIGVSVPSASDYDRLFGGARLGIEKAIEFTKDLNAEGLLLAGAIFGEGSKLFDALKAEIDFALKVGDLKNVDWNALPDSIQRLYVAAKLSVVLASEAAKAIGLDLTQEAAAFAEAATTVVQLYDATAKSFGDASITRDIYPATIENIANGIELAIRGIAGIRQRVTDAMLKESEGAAAGINASLSVISAAGAAFKDLGIDDSGKAPNFNIGVIDNLLKITEYSFDRIVELAHKVKPEDRAAAVAFSTDTRIISTNMADGLGFLKAIADQPALSISSFDTMVNNVANMDTALARAEELMIHARDDSASFLAASIETKDNVLAGVMNLADALAASTTANASSFAGGGDVGGQSFGALSYAPTPAPNFTPTPGGSSAASSQTTQHVNVQAGALQVNITLPAGSNLTPSQGRELGRQFAQGLEEWARNNRGKAQANSQNQPGALDFINFVIRAPQTPKTR